MGCGRDRDFGKKDLGCVCQAVRAIKDIQDAGDDCNECRNDCFLEPLGTMVSPANRVNTRIFKLYLKNGDTFKAHIKGKPWKSPFFRVKEIFDNCCATLQVLKPEHHGGHGGSRGDSRGEDFDEAEGMMSEWELTGDCITVDLDCFCAIQCIKDVYVDLCED
ncbi:spore coat protein CotZ [Bacillus haikouensis]|uniref:CotY/CotZ family spore coat protein n=1 Tax=Bacillus haikouensis TaxID=1510468 RepID=UPI0015549A74|nr:CotY/CotZ family spore coat protein [Bacillus haikouensis]NQD67234.1 spore coat protein CotZ [Bacillus haikouensis]